MNLVIALGALNVKIVHPLAVYFVWLYSFAWLCIFCVLIPMVDPSVAENRIFGEVKFEMRDSAYL